MPNPIDTFSAFLGAVAIHQDCTPLSEAALLRDETRAAANNDAKAYQAHNFAEVSSEEEDDDNSIFCEAQNLDSPPPAFLHNYMLVHDKPPSQFKLINSKKELPKVNHTSLTLI